MILFLTLISILLMLSLFEIVLNKGNTKSIYFKIYFSINFTIIYLLFAFNRYNSDYDSYVKAFTDQLPEGTMEKGYLYLIEIVKKMNGNHNWIIIFSATFFMYVIFYKKKVYYGILFLFLYFISNFIYDINQIRNLLMISLVYFALSELEKGRNLRALVIILISSTIHKIGLLYLIFYIFNIILKKNYIKIFNKLIYFSLFFTMIAIINREKIIGLVRNILILLSGRYSYFNGVNLGVFISLFQFIISLLLIKICIKKQEKSIYFKFLLFNMLFLPFCFISKELYQRIYRNSIYAKWYLIIDKMREKKLSIRILSYLLLLSEGLDLFVLYFRSNEFAVRIIGHISKISFTF